ncbi:hypothetical protein V2J09_000649 [Rumex salicifolius]
MASSSSPPLRSSFFLYSSSSSLLPLALIVAALSLLPSPASSVCTSPVIFNFGDSNSDTGGLAAGLGFPVNPPNGRSFFRRSTGRLSDGRQSLNTKLLSPYMDSVGSNFHNGANFAVVGSSTLPEFLPFALNIQIMQFIHFKARSLQLGASGSPSSLISTFFYTFMRCEYSIHDAILLCSKGPINPQGFRSALYMIDLGQNDLSNSFAKNLPYAQVIRRIPLVVAQIKYAVKRLYGEGGRKFWIHNTGPLGCLPQKLSTAHHTPKDLDSNGCISSYNMAAKMFNEALMHSTQQMRSEMKDATFVYVDIYAIKYDMVSNASRYGFSKPLMTCCGFGGPPYNYDIRVTCGTPGYKVCADGSQFMNWDGIHYTEAANAIVAKKLLSTQYSTPRISFDFFCR